MDLKIARNGSRGSNPGPSETFTGNVRVDPLFQAAEPARASGASVTFEPGARTAWHTHPLGQTLIVTSGRGWVQQRDTPRVDIQPGDVVWIPADVEHWHGAQTTTAMTHIAIQEQVDGAAVAWRAHVADDEYTAE